MEFITNEIHHHLRENFLEMFFLGVGETFRCLFRVVNLNF